MTVRSASNSVLTTAATILESQIEQEDEEQEMDVLEEVAASQGRDAEVLVELSDAEAEAVTFHERVLSRWMRTGMP